MTVRNFTYAEMIRSRTAQERRIDNRLSPPGLLQALEFTMAGLERVRAALGSPMEILSGYRCPELNAAVRGAPDSQHMRAEAADFVCPDFGGPGEIVEKLTPLRFMLGIDQLILEPSCVHVSFTLAPRYQVLHVPSRVT